MRNPIYQNIFVRMQKTLLFLFILLLPTQLGKHFLFPFSYISGIRIDYLTPTVYVLDILVVLLIISVAPALYNSIKKNHRIFLLFCGLVFFNIIFSPQPILGLYGAIKLFEVIFVGMIFYILRPSFTFVLVPFCLTSFIELFLAVAQVSTHGSLQGMFYLFGERYLNVSMPGIAKTSLNGRELLRPYATFSHPNSLGGFYVLLYCFVLFFTQKLKGKMEYVRLLLLLLCSLLILISFSKTAIIVYVMVSLYFIVLRLKSSCFFCKFARILGILSVSGLFLSATRSFDAIGERTRILQQGMSALLNHPFLGVGISQNISALAHFPSQNPYFFFQPIHNIFLLALVEWGIPLTLFVSWCVWSLIKKNISRTLLALLFVIGVTGMMDHYSITLEQNMLLMGALFGLALTKTNPTLKIGFVKDK